MRNLERYGWLMERVEEDSDLIFEELPHALADAGAEYFRMDRPRRTTRWRIISTRSATTIRESYIPK